MEQLIRKNDLVEGMRVHGIHREDEEDFFGTIYKIIINDSGRESATIKRDDGKTGSGVLIKEPPYNKRPGWIVRVNKDDYWGASVHEGELYALDLNWKKIIEG